MAMLLIFLLLFPYPLGKYQKKTAPSPAVEIHIHALINRLPPESFLRRDLEQGARGDGVHHSWMDLMRQQGVKRVVVWIDIRFNRKGRPKQMKINRTEFFAQYAGGVPISDAKQLNAVRASGLERELDDLALSRAAHGFWVDVPHPIPHPFVGGTKLEFFDDEWLPGIGVAGYFAGLPPKPATAKSTRR